MVIVWCTRAAVFDIETRFGCCYFKVFPGGYLSIDIDTHTGCTQQDYIMEVKVTFGFRRNDYSEEAKVSIDKVIKMELERKLKGKGITTYRIYTPNRNTVKVVFISEDDLNKVFDNKDYFMNAGLTPKTNISLKASRTFFFGGV